MIEKVVSGGQTGVDRAALDAAIRAGLPHGGWCPRGRRAEDGPIPLAYRLRETPETDYTVRTERNVVESDGTLILFSGILRGGTRLTDELATSHEKPCATVHLDLKATRTDPQIIAEVLDWLREHRVRILNVAGPRESQMPGIYTAAQRFLLTLFAQIDERDSGC